MSERNNLIEEQRLRNYIKKAIKIIQDKKIEEGDQVIAEEKQLRDYIINLIESGTVGSPHGSTGINVLEDLLKKIIPQLEIEYKKLTTTPEQRESFRTHILNAIQNSLAPTKISDKAGSEEEAEQAIDIGLEEHADMTTAFAQSDTDHKSAGVVADEWRMAIGELETKGSFYVRFENGNVFKVRKENDDEYTMLEPEWKEFNILNRSALENVAIDNPNYEIMNLSEWKTLNEEEDIEMEVGDEEFIDIETDGVEVEEETEEEKFGVDGEDETGRNIAFAAFERIEQAVVDSYSLLSNDEDRELFYDYLITNIKLYFDKFEDELLKNLPEPTTPEYEQEKSSQADTADMDDEPLEEPDDLEL
jgi:hypothetical protein